MADVLMENFQKYGQKVTVEKDEFILSPATLKRKNGPYLPVSGVVALATITKEGEERVYLYFKGKKLIGFAPFHDLFGDVQISGNPSGDRVTYCGGTEKFDYQKPEHKGREEIFEFIGKLEGVQFIKYVS